jgi:diguanylate cyclase (GGDEF)-like protein
VPDQTPLRDELTDLPARPLMREHLALAVARAGADEREVALLHVGLDGFRHINDGLGRPAGDAALRQVAARLEDLTGPVNVVARPGGDQFCVMLADIRGGAEQMVEMVGAQVEAVLREPFEIAGAEFELSASIGASMFPLDARDEDSLIAHAEAAMHEAKQLGAGTLALYSGGTQDAYERLVLPLRLRTALESDDFVLHYQPIVSVPGERVAAVEALIRFCDPRRGLVPPIEFLPAAEFTGLIEPIGEWVLDAACRQSLEWRQTGRSIPISVNVSLREVRDSGYAARAARLVDRHGLAPQDFILEVTESTAMEDPRCAEDTMTQLRRLGFRIAIDDFGTGYSSLARLRQMPVDLVKLDRTLLEDVHSDEGARRLVTAAINLIHTLDMTAVAEGVENSTQLTYLTDSGCTLAQGFHLARPLPGAEVAELLAR